MGLICASVPAMRSLFKILTSESSYRNAQSYELDHGSFNRLEENKGQVRSNIFSGGSQSSDLSNGSKTNIVPKTNEDVMQTTAFRITYSKATL